MTNTANRPPWVLQTDDMQAPAATLRVGSSAPTTNTTFGWLEFAHNADNEVFFQFQIPHSWAEGTPMVPHVHWCKTTAATGEVEWQLEYRECKIGDTLDGTWTTLSAMTPEVDDEDTQYQHALTVLGTIETDIPSWDISDFLICKLTRLGSSYSGADHYTAAAALLGFDIHIEKNSIGSAQPFVKGW